MAGDTGNQKPNPLEMRVIGLESSVNEILDLLRKAPTPLSHEFKPQQLGKLIPSVTAKATTTMYALEDGTLRAMDMAPIKDLPDFSTFMCTLGVYFQILYCYAGTPGSIQAVTDVAISTQAYTNLLHEYSHYFSYPAILTYHITHHSCRIREMIRGDYSL
ncbi:hypothetical protein PLEOSDRAFT_1081472 [Pleurotus ostreatus PC15]|uniref:Uncharacterized protein n=1 Tax=Pleurotus ostreatus (strain PC15) TaxID=1137138 RepID=A0A067P8J9_PLEO1|nr:hypothetical protein PLEOSDRAFT_1081472 [Pleurotus ostreatus PC15]